MQLLASAKKRLYALDCSKEGWQSLTTYLAAQMLVDMSGEDFRYQCR